MAKKRVLVIGAGASGLTAIKCCVDEGLDVVCVERTDDIGGLWNFTQAVRDGQACVMKTTVINTSKEMMCYSDFPIPADYPIFMHNTKVLEYFRLYADKFDLLKWVHFNTEVLHVKQAPDFEKTGQWNVQLKDKKSGEEREEVFDAVMICTGHHAQKHVATFPGQEDFQGKIVHTHDYKDHVGLENKRVVVVGIGNSGGDVAVELSRVSEQVYLSTRRGSWVANRVYDTGVPIDMFGTRRANFAVKDLLPSSWFNSMVESKLNKRFDHAKYGLQPKHRFDAQHPMVNDELPNRIACGTVIIKPNIKRILKNAVEFEDGTVEENIDEIIMATGYIFGYPFLDKSVIEVKKNVIDLYKYAFPPDLAQPTLSVIGCVQPWGAIMPIAELQCRLSARLFKGVTKLPSRFDMWADIRGKQKAMAERYVGSQRHTIQVDWIPFMDEVAEHVGCRPNCWEIFKEDPKLGLQVVFGPCTPYQYRIQGPGKWSGAKEAIMTQWDRTYAPMKSRFVESTSSGQPWIVKVMMLILLFWILRWLLGF